MCRVPRLSDQRLRFFALTVEFYAYDDQLPSPPVGLGRASSLGQAGHLSPTQAMIRPSHARPSPEIS